MNSTQKIEGSASSSNADLVSAGGGVRNMYKTTVTKLQHFSLKGNHPHVETAHKRPVEIVQRASFMCVSSRLRAKQSASLTRHHSHLFTKSSPPLSHTRSSPWKSRFEWVVKKRKGRRWFRTRLQKKTGEALEMQKRRTPPEVSRHQLLACAPLPGSSARHPKMRRTRSTRPNKKGRFGKHTCVARYPSNDAGEPAPFPSIRIALPRSNLDSYTPGEW